MQAGFIKILQEEYSVLKDLIDTILDDTASVRRNFDELKSLVSSHLEKEDKEFYTMMSQLARDNVIIRVILNIYKEDIDRLSRNVQDFFDKVDSGKVLIHSGLSEDFLELLMRLKIRIETEETSIFPMFLKAIG